MKVYVLCSVDPCSYLTDILRVFREKEEAERHKQKCDAIARAKKATLDFYIEEVECV